MGSIQSEINEPILFRTTTDEVATATLNSGSIWLRSDQYYREIEDAARQDASEGVNFARLGVSLDLAPVGGYPISIQGSGSIGQQIVPHYIASFHASSITMEQRRAFGGHTMGIRNFSRLSAEALYRCSLQIRCGGYRYGPVFYQHATLALMNFQVGGSAMQLASDPPTYLNPLGTDVLRKAPVAPFIDQDEWRIVIFTDGYLGAGPSEPIRINVDPSNFYDYERLPQ